MYEEYIGKCFSFIHVLFDLNSNYVDKSLQFHKDEIFVITRTYISSQICMLHVHIHTYEQINSKT